MYLKNKRSKTPLFIFIFISTALVYSGCSKTIIDPITFHETNIDNEFDKILCNAINGYNIKISEALPSGIVERKNPHPQSNTKLQYHERDTLNDLVEYVISLCGNRTESSKINIGRIAILNIEEVVPSMEHDTGFITLEVDLTMSATIFDNAGRIGYQEYKATIKGDSFFPTTESRTAKMYSQAISRAYKYSFIGKLR